MKTTEEEIRELAEGGDWSGAVNVAVHFAGIGEEEIARGLEVTLSTVGRWVRNETSPVVGLIPWFTEKLLGLLHA